MNKNQNQEEHGFILFLTGLAFILWSLLYFNSKAFLVGLRGVSLRIETLLSVLLWFTFCACCVYFNYAHLRFLDWLVSFFKDVEVFYPFSKLDPNIHIFLFFGCGLFIFLVFRGTIEIAILRRYQNSIDTLGFKNGKKESPKVVRIIQLCEDNRIIRIKSSGIGPEEWEKKRSNLSFELRSYINDIGVSRNKKYIEIFTSKSDLPHFIKFDAENHILDKPFSFIVGESKEGLVTESIRNCPHILMGGSTGMGKSTAFKLMLYSLIKSSPQDQIKFVLLDLKQGVEVSDFEDILNIRIAKNEEQACRELSRILIELKKRYEYLEDKKFKKIEPKRDNKPLIVLAVDEASVIFGTQSGSSDQKKFSDQARKMCQNIAKLGRAAGIHMILATQRATKTSIDTTTLDNLEARMCFRARSVSGSVAILGDNSGLKLPSISGRAIWQRGIQSKKVQVPYISEFELKKLCQEFKSYPHNAKPRSQPDKNTERKQHLEFKEVLPDEDKS